MSPAASCLLLLCSYSQVTVNLVQDGKPSHQIVLKHDASSSERYAAEKLQSHFQECICVKPSIMEGFPEEDVPMIVLGCGRVAQRLGVNPSYQQLGEQGYILKTIGQNVVIAMSMAQ